MRYARVALIAVITMSLAAAASAITYTVTNGNDSGPGSLRDAITQANATPADDSVRFGIGPIVLTPATPYPATVGKLFIDGSAFFNGTTPGIVIDASSLSAPAFHISSGSSLGFVTIYGDHGAAIEAGDDAIIGQDFIGTNISGSAAIPNAVGILVTGVGARIFGNLISGNGTGIEVMSTAAGTAIYNNHIGQSASGAFAIPNGIGVDVSGNGTVAGLEIGTLELPNMISGNSGAAIRVTSFNSVTISGNYIGTADFFGKPMGNGAGIELNGNNASITGNVIANNSGTAIWIGGGTGNKISKNSIAKNGFGIDLGNTRDGHTTNDGLDGDSGPNGLQNQPVITLALDNLTAPTPTATITGTLSSAPNAAYSIELFGNTNCAAGDYINADSYLTTLTVTTDSSGNASFSFTGNSILYGTGVSATATDAQNNTSEISNCSVVTRHGAFALPMIPSSAFEAAGSVSVQISRVGGSVGAVTVDYATSAPPATPDHDPATPGVDYTPIAGTLTFADGEVSKTVTIPILDDKLYETNEIIVLTLSHPTGGATLDFISSNLVYILDDEPQSKISIADGSVLEGNSGITLCKVPVTLSTPAGFPVTVKFIVGSQENATAGEDYQPFSGSITFAPGESVKTIDVPVFGDTTFELEEVFGVTLLSATPENLVAFTNFAAHGHILNDDIGKITCTPSAPSVLEGPAGTITNVEITCTPDAQMIQGWINYQAVNGTAKLQDSDFGFTSGSIVFNYGSGPAKFTVPIVGDDTIEPDEQFTIKLTATPVQPSNFVVEPAEITVTIVNDDTPGVVTCQSLGAIEGNSGLNNAAIACGSPSKITGTIDYVTHDGTATAPADYQAVSGTLTFNNETTKSFFVPIVGDTTVEPDEQFTITLTAHPASAPALPFSLAHDTVVVTIPNDDQPQPAQVIVLAPARLASRVGETTQVRASLEPPSDTAVNLTIVAFDSSIADAPSAVAIAPNQPTFIPVTAKKRGSTSVSVSAGNGTGAAVLLVDVTEGSPSLTALEPAMGSVPGGVNVSLHGANLSAGCIVSFGGMPVTSAVFSSATTATVVAPAHAAGTVDVTLTCGSTSSTLEKAFTYVASRGRSTRH